jgi:hypothetical protein
MGLLVPPTEKLNDHHRVTGGMMIVQRPADDHASDAQARA